MRTHPMTNPGLKVAWPHCGGSSMRSPAFWVHDFARMRFRSASCSKRHCAGAAHCRRGDDGGDCPRAASDPPNQSAPCM